MNRQDWVFIAVRLYGVYLLVEGVVGLPKLMELSLRVELPSFVAVVVKGIVGLVLVACAGRISGWGEPRTTK